MADFSNLSSQLKDLFKSLHLDEVFERLHALDSKGDAGPIDPPFNPTDNPEVQPNLEGVGTLSGGPEAENTSDPTVIDPEYVAKVQRTADQIEAEKAAAEPEPVSTSGDLGTSTPEN